MSDTLGWMATTLMVWASYDIAHFRIRGLWFMALGNVIWAVTGVMSGLSSLVAVSIVMMVMDFYGIKKWSDNKLTHKKRRGKI